MSKKFERWKELAARCLDEQDPAKLTELANEMNRVLIQKTPHLDPPLQAAGSREESQSSMKTSPNYPQSHEDRKAQKLLNRIDEKLQAKYISQNSPKATSPKECLGAA
jgi:hypothetical protein